MQHISRIKDKSHLIISVDAEKRQNSTSFYDKIAEGTTNRWNLLQSNKDYIQQTHSPHHIKRGELKSFPLKSAARKGCPLSPLLSNIILEFLARAIRQDKEIKGIQIGKEKVMLSLFGYGTILYLIDPKNSTKTLLDTINTFSKAAGYKINIKTLHLFYTPTKNRVRKKLGKQSHLQ
jgi:hypothetical protein